MQTSKYFSYYVKEGNFLSDKQFILAESSEEISKKVNGVIYPDGLKIYITAVSIKEEVPPAGKILEDIIIHKNSLQWHKDQVKLNKKLLEYLEEVKNQGVNCA